METASDFLGTPYANYGFNLPVLTLAGVGVWGLQSQDSFSPAMPVAQSVAVTAAVTELTKRLSGETQDLIHLRLSNKNTLQSTHRMK